MLSPFGGEAHVLGGRMSPSCSSPDIPMPLTVNHAPCILTLCTAPVEEHVGSVDPLELLVEVGGQVLLSEVLVRMGLVASGGHHNVLQWGH